MGTDQHVMRFGPIPGLDSLSGLGPLSSPEENDPDQFLKRAKKLVMEQIFIDSGFHMGTPPEIYIVWFCKTLQNWKSVLSTNIPNGVYYEVTYDGNKKQAYVDTYQKVANRVYPDDAPLNIDIEE